MQTLPWMNDGRGIDQAIQAAHKLGYQGVEIAHVIDAPKQVVELKDFLQEYSIEVAGVSGGSMRQRIKLAKELSIGSNIPYLYADDWTDDDGRAYEVSDYAGKVAIHPHMFKPIQTMREARSVLNLHPYTCLMPDSAHLTIAGENILTVIEEFHRRIIAVHLKDWTPVYGRSLPFYSSGFVVLGEGKVPIKEVISLLTELNYNGWIIVEQDSASDPDSAAAQARQFLRKLGI